MDENEDDEDEDEEEEEEEEEVEAAVNHVIAARFNWSGVWSAGTMEGGRHREREKEGKREN